MYSLFRERSPWTWDTMLELVPRDQKPVLKMPWLLSAIGGRESPRYRVTGMAASATMSRLYRVGQLDPEEDAPEDGPPGHG
ncbi:hypothetical protein [Streptomyces sp. N50]|uniref:hypothetical protein n=1 Tax=Streptomyces sp. N50 TaxID=3081765 RepID=UPI0029624C9B|nr:hypothetical protein [Streptomyces sp. N50]WOX16166.1 hypothetical protein R2B38_45850 [Streptomyces sp. N50]